VKEARSAHAGELDESARRAIRRALPFGLPNPRTRRQKSCQPRAHLADAFAWRTTATPARRPTCGNKKAPYPGRVVTDRDTQLGFRLGYSWSETGDFGVKMTVGSRLSMVAAVVFMPLWWRGRHEELNSKLAVLVRKGGICH
jgi:hypothetical protein